MILQKLYIHIVLLIFITSSFLNSANNSNQKILTTKILQGERIFFVRKHDIAGMRIGDIYSMNSSGREVQQLTNFSDNFYITELPEISPDGRTLSFISNYESWKSSFYLDAFIIDLESGIFKRVTGDERPYPSNKLADVEVVVKDPLGYAISSSAIRVSYKGCANFFSGDSLILAVPADEDIWIKAELAKGKGDVEFVRIPSAGEPARINLSLSAGTISAESCFPYINGDQLVVSVNYESPTIPFYKIGIWDSNGIPFFMQDVGGHSLGGDTHPSYSKDGSMLAFCTGQHGTNSLAVLPTSNLSDAPTILVSGSNFGLQAFCANPTWSPDGSEIVFVYTIINGLEIQSNLYKVSVNGGEPTQLTYYSGNEIVSKPTISPDGTHIAFTYLKSAGSIFYLTDLINGTYSSNIYTVSSDGTTITALTNDGYSLDPSWGVVSSTVSVDKDYTNTESYQLYQNYPNPFNPTTRIKYEIPSRSKTKTYNVTLIVYDVLGKQIATIVNGPKSPGNYEVSFNAESLSSDIYFYQLRVGDFIDTKKMVLIR